MRSPEHAADVLIIGAGPAGSSAAYQLAKEGVHTMVLDRAFFPRDKACGDGLLPGAVDWLERIGISTDDLLAPAIRGVRMTVAGHGSGKRDFPTEAKAVTVPRRTLDRALIDRAIGAGAELFEGFAVTGVSLSNGALSEISARDGYGQVHRFLGRTVIAADGSNSFIARSVGLHSNASSGRGIALRAYFAGVSSLDDFFHIYLPLVAPDGRRLVGYGWVFPLGGDMANIGVGLLRSDAADRTLNLRQIFEGFISRLKATDSQFARLVQTSAFLGAPLNCSFDPSKTAVDGLMLVGDAAGLVDPLTGEGIQSALESGTLAAQVIADGVGKRQFSQYRQLLSERYSDRLSTPRKLFGTGRFAWRLLEETFSLKGKLFSSFRTAAFDFGLQTAQYTTERGPKQEPSVGLNRIAFFERVHSLIDKTLKRDFPIAARTSRQLVSQSDTALRAAIYWITARWGNAQSPKHVAGAACVELSYWGYRILEEIEHNRFADNQNLSKSFGAEWHTAFPIMVTDLLLVKSLALAACELGPQISQLLAETGAKVCAAEASAHIRAASEIPISDQYLGYLPRRKPAFMALAATIAAKLANLEDNLEATLTDYARLLSTAFCLAVEAAEFSEIDRSAFVESAAARVWRQGWSFPFLMALEKSGGDLSATHSQSECKELMRIVQLESNGVVLEETLNRSRDCVMQAKSHALSLPRGRLREEMLALADTVLPAGAGRLPGLRPPGA